MKQVWLESFEIYGLWGSRDLKRKVSGPVSIMYGANGTGKTTIMNLLAASISVDIKKLTFIEFEKVKIVFKVVGKNIKPVIEISKEMYDGIYEIVYRIKEKTTDDETPYVITYDYDPRRRKYLEYERYGGVNSEVRRKINSFIGCTWLTIDRGKSDVRVDQTAIDQKLDSLSNDFIRYCSKLDAEQIKLREDFQRTVFKLLLSSKRKDNFTESLNKINFSKEQQSLNEIYAHYSIDEKGIKEKITNHYEETEDYLRKWNDGKPLKFEQLLTLFDTVRNHRIIEAWNKQKRKMDDVFKQRDLFFNTLNSLFHYKTLHFESGKDLYALTNSNKKLQLRDLSSGEKQLFILFTEALLQEMQPWIYLADEPELSLHIKWQEVVIDCIRNINPNSQIFFATHSPDIISHYGDSSFDLEKVLDDSL